MKTIVKSKVVRSPHFKKNFIKRFRSKKKSLIKKIQERIELFVENPSEPSLKNHKLRPHSDELWEFHVAGDIVVVYYFENSTRVLYDIGTHAQIFG